MQPADAETNVEETKATEVTFQLFSHQTLIVLLLCCYCVVTVLLLCSYCVTVSLFSILSVTMLSFATHIPFPFALPFICACLSFLKIYSSVKGLLKNSVLVRLPISLR